MKKTWVKENLVGIVISVCLLVAGAIVLTVNPFSSQTAVTQSTTNLCLAFYQNYEGQKAYATEYLETGSAQFVHSLSDFAHLTSPLPMPTLYYGTFSIQSKTGWSDGAVSLYFIAQGTYTVYTC